MVAEAFVPGARGDGELRLIVLAGGQSRRMGRDKRLLRLGGKSLLRWVVDAGRPLQCAISILRHDLIPGTGPLGGIATAFAHFPNDHMLFVPCDMPFLTPSLLERVILKGVDSSQAVASQVAGRVGFPILLPRRAVDVIESQRQAGDQSVRGLMNTLGAHFLEWAGDEEWRFLNVNTREDLAKAQRLLAR